MAGSAAPPVDTFPRWFLSGAAGVMLFAIIAAATASWTNQGATRVGEPPVAGVLELRFVAQPDRTMLAQRVTDGRTLEVLPADGSGFIRGAVRSLLRQRMLSGQDVNLSFHLIERKDGRFSLVDPATRTRMELDGFGPTNSEAFARLYRAGQGEPTARP
jgi:putative photosynthetic complex assembly protein